MANLQRMTPKRLGEIFTHSGLVTPEQLEESLADQQKTGKHLGELMVERGYVTERDVADVMILTSRTNSLMKGLEAGMTATEWYEKEQRARMQEKGHGMER